MVSRIKESRKNHYYDWDDRVIYARAGFLLVRAWDVFDTARKYVSEKDRNWFAFAGVSLEDYYRLMRGPKVDLYDEKVVKVASLYLRSNRDIRGARKEFQEFYQICDDAINEVFETVNETMPLKKKGEKQ